MDSPPLKKDLTPLCVGGVESASNKRSKNNAKPGRGRRA